MIHHPPEMTNPLGKYWDQPPRELVLIDDETAVMDMATFAKLPVYQTSEPSGVYVGKMWVRHAWNDWFLLFYDQSESPDKCWVRSRKIIFLV